MLRVILITFLILTIEVSAQPDSVISYYNNGKIESIIHAQR